MQSVVPRVLLCRRYPTVHSCRIESENKLPKAEVPRVKAAPLSTEYPATEIVVGDTIPKTLYCLPISTGQHSPDNKVNILLPG